MNKAVRFLAKYRRLYGLLVLIPFFFLARPSVVSLAIGLPVMVLGLLFRIWSSGYIYKDDRLAVEGPYSIVRNPLYFGSFLMGAGCLLAGSTWIPSWILFILYIVTFPAVYVSLILTEEERLLQLFGDEYAEYCSSVPRLLPAFWKYKRADAEWSFKLTFIVHKEYTNVIIAAVLIGFLILKSIFHF